MYMSLAAAGMATADIRARRPRYLGRNSSDLSLYQVRASDQYDERAPCNCLVQRIVTQVGGIRSLLSGLRLSMGDRCALGKHESDRFVECPEFARAGLRLDPLFFLAGNSLHSALSTRCRPV